MLLRFLGSGPVDGSRRVFGLVTLLLNIQCFAFGSIYCSYCGKKLNVTPPKTFIAVGMDRKDQQ